MKKPNKQVVIVDDDPDYVNLIEEAFRSCKSCPAIHVLNSGHDLLTWLQTSQQPSLILLDINMPGMNGLEVLASLKSKESYKTIPVVMLTVSEAAQDIKNSYKSGANSYVSKPMTFGELVSQVEVLNQYWFDITTTPSSN